MNELTTLDPGTVPLAWRPPFARGPTYRDMRPYGETLEEIARSVPDLPEVFWRRGVICVNGEPALRERWHRIRPKSNSPEKPIVVTLHLPLQSGGGSGGGSSKQVVAIVAAIALTFATAGIGAFGLPFLGIAAGSTLAQVAAVAVSVSGKLEIVPLQA